MGNEVQINLMAVAVRNARKDPDKRRVQLVIEKQLESRCVVLFNCQDGLQHFFLGRLIQAVGHREFRELDLIAIGKRYAFADQLNVDLVLRRFRKASRAGKNPQNKPNRMHLFIKSLHH